MIRKDVFSIKEIFILYFVTVILFIISSNVLIGAIGINGIPFTHLLSIFAPSFLLMLIMKKDIKKLYFLNTPKNIRYFFWGILLWIGAIILSGIYTYYAVKFMPTDELIESFDYIFSQTTLTQQIIIMAAVPAVIEELFFRGVILFSMMKKTNIVIAVLVSSLLFSLMHFSIIKIFPTFLLGGIFAYVVYKTNSIIPAMVLHFVNNSMSIIAQNALPNIDIDTLWIISGQFDYKYISFILIIISIKEGKIIYERI
ncbi:MAG: type II CAAX endopeptidase family protein [Bacillota bacterium]|nr:type II CAAX endopeptidase family protein [Bacillota bacterium]